MKILLSGGGTMGSVSPLIAVYQEIKDKRSDVEFMFIGTKIGPEKEAVESYKMPFKAISSGKLRRYFSWQNLTDPFKIVAGFLQSFSILLKFKPNVVMVAGGFVGVPVAWTAWLLRIPVLIHQQDIIAGLANKLMANIATNITVSFEPSLKDFFPQKTVLTGNPVRKEFHACDYKKSRELFKLKEDLPALLILGGGTGAQDINQIIEKSVPQLLQFCQIVHITGRGKGIEVRAEGYQQFEFLTHGMTEAVCAADLVISRAGISTLSELIIADKPTILIPIPESHQEFNAQYFQKNNAVVNLSQQSLNSEVLVGTIKELFSDGAARDNLARNIYKVMPHDGAQQVAMLLLTIAK
ncbi:MAG: undecaprenyldiphospho-muramoylpentapeptide beta-N-acetylglucosaminyltransferase [Patescibacteria group bacterium]